MSGQHAGPVHLPVSGECEWRWHSDGVDLYCDNLPTIGELLCELHRQQAAEGVAG